MSPELIFRIVFTASFLLILGAAFAHRWSAKTSERLNRQGEGTVILVLLRLLGLFGWGGALVYIINPVWLAWASVPLPEALRWVGVALAIAVIPLGFWATRSLGKNVTDSVSIRREHQLVTTGAYAWVRHPLYSIGIVFFIALTLLSANWYFGLCTLLVTILLVIRLPREEAALIEKFGDDYRVYMQRTGRFVPRISL